MGANVSVPGSVTKGSLFGLDLKDASVVLGIITVDVSSIDNINYIRITLDGKLIGIIQVK